MDDRSPHNRNSGNFGDHEVNPGPFGCLGLLIAAAAWGALIAWWPA